MPPVAPNNNQAPTTNYGDAYNSFENVYAPQVQAVQAQQAQALQTKNTTLAQLDQDKTTNLSSLDQAKVNAFKDNATTANARGLNFSGYTPYTNDQYTTNTYNPGVDKVNTDYTRGVADTNTTYDQNNQSLIDKITAINQQRANDANTLVLNTQQAQQEAAQAAAKSAGKVSTAAANKAAAANYVQGTQGQYQFVNSSGKAINLQQYVNATGGNINTVLGLLQNGTGYDKAIYNKVVNAKPANATVALNLIRQLDSKKAYGF